MNSALSSRFYYNTTFCVCQAFSAQNVVQVDEFIDFFKKDAEKFLSAPR